MNALIDFHGDINRNCGQEASVVINNGLVPFDDVVRLNGKQPLQAIKTVYNIEV